MSDLHANYAGVCASVVRSPADARRLDAANSDAIAARDSIIAELREKIRRIELKNGDLELRLRGVPMR